MAKEEKISEEVSRRNFLKNAGLLVGGAVLASATLTSCTGPEGATGAAGVAGPQGEKGEKGDKGDKGDTGAAGAPAPAFVLPVKVALSKGVITVDKELCNGCMTCVLTCSLQNAGTGSFELSRMHMAASTQYVFDAYAEPCQQCVDPECLRYCPAKAIKVDENTGARVIDEKLCIGCQTCIAHCPYTPARISFNKQTNKATKCTLCDGDPACVKACPTGALQYYTNPDGVATGYTLQGGI